MKIRRKKLPIHLKKLSALNVRLAELTVEERTGLPSISRQRAEVIMAGGQILEGVMQALKIETLQPCSYALREGVIIDYLRLLEAESLPPVPDVEDKKLRDVFAVGRRYGYEESHALQVADLAEKIFDALAPVYKLSRHGRTLLSAAALLHDVGHGAFSHVIETILGFHHEDFTIEAILSRDTEVGRVLREFSAELPENVAAIIRGNFQRVALAQIVSSQLDADRMDYLLRDSLMTGAKYGVYDLEWIIKSLEIDEENDRLYVSARAVLRRYLQSSGFFNNVLRNRKI